MTCLNHHEIDEIERILAEVDARSLEDLKKMGSGAGNVMYQGVVKFHACIILKLRECPAPESERRFYDM